MRSIYKGLYDMSAQGFHRKVLRRLISPAGRIYKPYSSDLNHAWYIVGDELYLLGNKKEAVLAFKNSLRHRKHDVEAMMAIANCYSDLGNPRMAQFYLARAIKIDSDNDGLRYNLGNSLLDLGKYSEAISEYALVKTGSGLSRLAKRNSKRAESLMNKR